MLVTNTFYFLPFQKLNAFNLDWPKISFFDKFSTYLKFFTSQSLLLKTRRKDSFEHIVERGENVRNQHFLFLPECFLHVYKEISLFYLFTKLQILDWSKFKAFADGKIYVNKKNEILFGKGRKHCGERRTCWLPAFSPFPTIFFKVIFHGVVKSRDCVVKG